MFWFTTPSSNKNLYKAWLVGKFLVNNCGWIVAKALLKFLIVSPGGASKLPVCSVVIAPEKKLRACVKGPNTVFAICVKPFGIITNNWYGNDLVKKLCATLSPSLIAVAKSALVYKPSNGLVYVKSPNGLSNFNPCLLSIMSLPLNLLVLGIAALAAAYVL